MQYNGSNFKQGGAASGRSSITTSQSEIAGQHYKQYPDAQGQQWYGAQGQGPQYGSQQQYADGQGQDAQFYAPQGQYADQQAQGTAYPDQQGQSGQYFGQQDQNLGPQGGLPQYPPQGQQLEQQQPSFQQLAEQESAEAVSPGEKEAGKNPEKLSKMSNMKSEGLSKQKQSNNQDTKLSAHSGGSGAKNSRQMTVNMEVDIPVKDKKQSGMVSASKSEAAKSVDNVASKPAEAEPKDEAAAKPAEAKSDSQAILTVIPQVPTEIVVQPSPSPRPADKVPSSPKPASSGPPKQDDNEKTAELDCCICLARIACCCQCIIILILILLYFLIFRKSKSSPEESGTDVTWSKFTGSWATYSDYTGRTSPFSVGKGKSPESAGSFRFWASHVSDKSCAEFPRKYLDMKATILEAAVGTVLCLSVTHPHTVSFGGGFLMLHYDRHHGIVRALNARESSGSSATQPELRDKAIGVPGLPVGLYNMLTFQSKEPSDSLLRTMIMDASNLAQDGYQVSEELAVAFSENAAFIQKTEQLKNLFPSHSLQAGAKIQNLEYATFLKELASNPEKLTTFQKEPYTAELASKLQGVGAQFITKMDISGYSGRWSEPIFVDLTTGHRIYSSPSPGIGALVCSTLQVFDHKNDMSDVGAARHRFAEAVRYALAHARFLGDEVKVPQARDAALNITSTLFNDQFAKAIEDSKVLDNTRLSREGVSFVNITQLGSSSFILIVTPEGDAVALSASLGLPFGSGVVHKGFILNNALNQFTSDPHNRIESHKRPLTGAVPSLILKNGVVFGAFGFSGYSYVEVMSWAMIKFIYNDSDATDCVRDARILVDTSPSHAPGSILAEQSLDGITMSELTRRGHLVSRSFKDFGHLGLLVRPKHGIISAAVDPKMCSSCKLVDGD